MRVDFIFKRNAEMIAIVKLKKYIAGIYIFIIVVYKFGHE